MKDFHDLYSLVTQPNCLNAQDTEKAVTMVFHHRKASLHELPLTFSPEALGILQTKWNPYHRGLRLRRQPITPPTTIFEIIAVINDWLYKNTGLCRNPKV